MFDLGGIEFLLVVGFILIVVGVPVFAYRDLIARGKPNLAVAVAITMFAVWPLGLAFWMYARARYGKVRTRG